MYLKHIAFVGPFLRILTALGLSILFIARKLNKSIPRNPLLVLLHTEFERLTFEVFFQPFKHIDPGLNIKPIPIVIGKLPDKGKQPIAQSLTERCFAPESFIQIPQVNRSKGALLDLIHIFVAVRILVAIKMEFEFIIIA